MLVSDTQVKDDCCCPPPPLPSHMARHDGGARRLHSRLVQHTLAAVAGDQVTSAELVGGGGST